jgi:RNA-directed DNA polymerase
LVRYADDQIALCHSRHETEQVKARLAAWLAPRGLVFNEDKTRVVTLEEGFDFLGFNVRRYHGKLLIRPSKAALRRIRERLRAEMWSLRGINARAVIQRLNPIIRGWAAYYRTVVSSEAFAALDDYMWKLTFKWARHVHPNKSAHWVVARYFDRFNKARRDRWVFGDRQSGTYLRKFAWTRIVRHQMVKGRASPDDPTLAEYWANRRRKAPPPPIGRTNQRLLKAQDGRCPLCGSLLLSPTTRHRAHSSGSSGWQPPARRSLMSRYGRTAHQTKPNPVSYMPTATDGATPPVRVTRHFCSPTSLEGLLEPDAVKAARPGCMSTARLC